MWLKDVIDWCDWFIRLVALIEWWDWLIWFVYGIDWCDWLVCLLDVMWLLEYLSDWLIRLPWSDSIWLIRLVDLFDLFECIRWLIDWLDCLKSVIDKLPWLLWNTSSIYIYVDSFNGFEVDWLDWFIWLTSTNIIKIAFFSKYRCVAKVRFPGANFFLTKRSNSLLTIS